MKCEKCRELESKTSPFCIKHKEKLLKSGILIFRARGCVAESQARIEDFQDSVTAFHDRMHTFDALKDKMPPFVLPRSQSTQEEEDAIMNAEIISLED